MSESTNFGFAKLVPGFDFLQNLSKGTAQGIPQMPNLSNWIAPTLNVEELDKRIGELKAVHFWLDQNSKALGATIQALEVQKMTLATLQGMNFNMGELANALRLKPAEPSGASARKQAAPEPVAPPAPEPAAAAKKAKKTGDPGAAGGSPVDPLQWWGSLTQQFQEIAASAMKDVAQQAATDVGKAAAAAKTPGPAPRGAGAPAAAPAAAKKVARKAPARKT